MEQAILFKILQRQTKFKNSENLLKIPSSFRHSEYEYNSAKQYILQLKDKGFQFTYPNDINYPSQFYKMKNPPLFLEYLGTPFWLKEKFLAVVGARDCTNLSKDWMSLQLSKALTKKSFSIVSGGAIGIDQWAHFLSIKNRQPTVVILPSGLDHIYPTKLLNHLQILGMEYVCLLTEFELTEKIQKSFFYHRNRLIACLSEMILVIEAEAASGTMITAHHALENGRPVITLPSHPNLQGFSGNLRLLADGAPAVIDGSSLLDFWHAELGEFEY